MKKRIICIVMSLALFLGVISAGFYFTGSAATSTTLEGDINCDNKFDQKDLGLLLKYLDGYDVSSLGTFDESKCDYNKDGKIDLYDALAINGKVVDVYSPPY